MGHVTELIADQLSLVTPLRQANICKRHLPSNYAPVDQGVTAYLLYAQTFASTFFPIERAENKKKDEKILYKH